MADTAHTEQGKSEGLAQRAVAGERNPPFVDADAPLLNDFHLESGERLSHPKLRVRVYGVPANPVIAVAGGISAGRAAADTASDKGWWREIVGAGAAIDLNAYRVVAFDFLPNPGEIASTITTGDQARAFAHALDTLQIDRLYSFIGASYGGMVALAFAEAFADRVDRLCIISASDRPHPAATAVRGIQRRIIDFGTKVGEPDEAVSLARQLAMTTYRTPEEFKVRFDSAPSPKAGDPYAVCDYLMSRGAAFSMDPKRYLTMSDSLDRHRIDPAQIKAPALFVAVTSDGLVPLEDIRALAEKAPNGAFAQLASLYGHDAFLKETESVSALIRDSLKEKKS
ncbi:MAG: homoserine O-succinyltransferase [Pseudomonadota bacterium]